MMDTELTTEEIRVLTEYIRRSLMDYLKEDRYEAITAMGKWKEGWHPTSRVKYPKPRYMKTYSCRESYIWQFNKADLYCDLFELRADILCEERRLQEKYERPIYS